MESIRYGYMKIKDGDEMFCLQYNMKDNTIKVQKGKVVSATTEPNRYYKLEFEDGTYSHAVYKRYLGHQTFWDSFGYCNIESVFEDEPKNIVIIESLNKYYKYKQQDHYKRTVEVAQQKHNEYVAKLLENKNKTILNNDWIWN